MCIYIYVQISKCIHISSQMFICNSTTHDCMHRCLSIYLATNAHTYMHKAFLHCSLCWWSSLDPSCMPTRVNWDTFHSSSEMCSDRVLFKNLFSGSASVNTYVPAMLTLFKMIYLLIHFFLLAYEFLRSWVLILLLNFQELIQNQANNKCLMDS